MSQDLFSLSGKRYLVTGGTRGIGRAISLHFARSGAAVVANYVRGQDTADSLLAEAERENLRIRVCRADLTIPKGLEELEAAVSADGQSLDGFIHCAATGVHKPIAELQLRHFDWTFALNARAFFELVRRLLPRFAPGASIIAVSSQGAVRAIPSYSIVGSSKGALEALARHLAVELAQSGLRVNILEPGAVATQAWDAMPDRDRRLAMLAEKTPIGRLVTPEEVAHAAHFLCSPASIAIVGQTLVVDGGASLPL